MYTYTCFCFTCGAPRPGNVIHCWEAFDCDTLSLFGKLWK